MSRRMVALFWCWALSACASPEDLGRSSGGPGDSCYPNGTCNAPLVCVANQCVDEDAGADAAAGGSGGGGGSGAVGGTGGGGGSSGSGGAGGSTGGTGSSGSGGTTATGGTGGSGGTTTTGGTGGSTGGVGGTGGTTATGGTGGAGGSGGTGGATGAPPAPGSPSGCTTCSCCDPWLIKWSASTGATYYNVLWKCSIFPLHTINVGNVLQADLCSSSVGMCASSECANGAGLLQVQACNTSGCSAAVSIPSAGVPIACGGGCCC